MTADHEWHLGVNWAEGSNVTPAGLMTGFCSWETGIFRIDTPIHLEELSTISWGIFDMTPGGAKTTEILAVIVAFDRAEAPQTHDSPFEQSAYSKLNITSYQDNTYSVPLKGSFRRFEGEQELPIINSGSFRMSLSVVARHEGGAVQVWSKDPEMVIDPNNPPYPLLSGTESTLMTHDE